MAPAWTWRERACWEREAEGKRVRSHVETGSRWRKVGSNFGDGSLGLLIFLSYQLWIIFDIATSLGGWTRGRKQKREAGSKGR